MRVRFRRKHSINGEGFSVGDEVNLPDLVGLRCLQTAVAERADGPAENRVEGPTETRVEMPGENRAEPEAEEKPSWRDRIRRRGGR